MANRGATIWLVFGLVALILISLLGYAFFGWPFVCDSALDPKNAPREERDHLLEILEVGYGSLENLAKGGLPLDTDAFSSCIRTELVAGQSTKSAWYQFRLMEELARLRRLEDVGFLLALGENCCDAQLRRVAKRLSSEMVADYSCERLHGLGG